MAADKLLLLPNGYNEDIFYREDVDKEALFSSLGLPYCGEYIVLFVGKLAAFKGVDTLLRAARRYEWLADREFITLIVGDGEEAGELVRAAQAAWPEEHLLPWQPEAGRAAAALQCGGCFCNALPP